MRARLAQRVDAAPQVDAFHAALGRAAIVSLYDELALAPKPGLVSFDDAGSHDDMDAGTFLRSLFALRHFFGRVAAQGACDAEFAPLEWLGIAAEARMLRATGGVNTHRGAIFTLGLLCAAAGAARDAGLRLQRDEPARHAARALGRRARVTRGARVRTRTARWPRARTGCAARARRRRKACRRCSITCCRRCTPRVARAPTSAARVCTRCSRRWRRSTTPTSSTAAAWRACASPRRLAREFLDEGGGMTADAPVRAARVHALFVERRLSPGGAADLLAAALWLERVERLDGAAPR